jgi:hypothetical protein
VNKSTDEVKDATLYAPVLKGWLGTNEQPLCCYDQVKPSLKFQPVYMVRVQQVVMSAGLRWMMNITAP